MKKSEQEKINQICLNAMTACNAEIDKTGKTKVARLRTCKAWVYETENYYILQSYSTLVAIIDKQTNTLFDLLRYVFGYTATSAQHIAKFNYDFCNKSISYWGCTERLTYR